LSLWGKEGHRWGNSCERKAFRGLSTPDENKKVTNKKNGDAYIKGCRRKKNGVT